MAVSLEDTEVLKKLIRTNWVKFDIHSWSIWKGNMELCDLLLKNNYKAEHMQELQDQDQTWQYLNDPVWGGWSPVTFQIYRTNIQMLSFLVKQNIEFDVNEVLPNKFTPLTWAIFKRNQELLEYLLCQKDIIPGASDEWNNDPFSYAKQMDNDTILACLSNHSFKETKLSKSAKVTSSEMQSSINLHKSLVSTPIEKKKNRHYCN